MPDLSPWPADLGGWLLHLERLHPKSIELGLDRVGRVAQRLGLKPQCPVITVAGTNGKGSTCAMLESVYGAAGYRTACYTSPHLLRYNERVRVDAACASDADLCAAFQAVEAARRGTSLTYFEFGTLAAVWHFMRAGVDVVILEAGLGGRLDAVNIFEPSCAIITSIDLDHTDYLGETRERIGYEKAGIFRHGVAAICGDPEPPDSVVRHARAIGADFRCIGVAFAWRPGTDGWTFSSRETSWPDLPAPRLSGSFQRGNAACALEAIATLHSRLPVPVAAIRHGLAHTFLPGRFQRCGTSPEIILDVAHNPHAARGLAENLGACPVRGRVLAVFGMLADKDIGGVVSALAPCVDVWYAASIHEPRGATSHLLAERLLRSAPQAVVLQFESPAEAFRQACLDAGENDRIAAFGSFYTVAGVLNAFPAARGAWSNACFPDPTMTG